jgi:HAD superfamily phosphoserine phosphatase-like hydrolase
MHRLAIFDMDKTITRKATFGPFVAHVLRHYRPWRAIFLPLMVLFGLLYGLKLIDRARLKELNLWLLIGSRINPAHLAAIARSFASETVQTNLLPLALKEIEVLRHEGWQIVLATASYRFYVVEIAGLLGIAPEKVIATENGRGYGKDYYQTPWIIGQNCYGGAKSDSIDAWLAVHGIVRAQAIIKFYSDHVSDAPSMYLANEAVAANPHAPLRKLAQEQGWRIADWM